MSTVCIVCERSGKGFSAKTIISTKGFKNASVLLLSKDGGDGGIPLSLSKARKQVLEKYKSSACAKSVYLWDMEAPGLWCEVYWFGKQEDIDRVSKSLLSMRSDIGGDYIHQRSLSDLSQDEKRELWENTLRA